MSSQLRKPETPAERNVRIATQQGAVHAEAVVAILKPFDEQTAAGAMPYAIVGGQVASLGVGRHPAPRRGPRPCRAIRCQGQARHCGIDA